MSRPRRMPSVVAVAVLIFTGCATGSGGTPGGDGGHVDGHITVIDSPTGTMVDAPVAQPDAPGSMCSKQPCSIVPQCGCTAGMACDLDGTMLSTGGTACRTAGPNGPNGACAAVTDCAAGDICLGSPGLCKKFCATNSDCPGALCVVQIVSGTMPIPGAIACSDACNPTNATGCGAGQGCHIYVVDPMATPVVNFGYCTNVGAGGQGAACTGDADCQADFGCFNNGTNTLCYKWCQKNPPAGTCPGATTCQSLNPPAVLSGVEYGVCG